MKTNYAQQQMEELAKIKAEVQANVDALENLDDEQRSRVYEISLAYALKNHRVPAYANIANLVRTTKPIPPGKALPKGAW